MKIRARPNVSAADARAATRLPLPPDAPPDRQRARLSRRRPPEPPDGPRLLAASGVTGPSPRHQRHQPRPAPPSPQVSSTLSCHDRGSTRPGRRARPPSRAVTRPPAAQVARELAVSRTRAIGQTIAEVDRRRHRSDKLTASRTRRVGLATRPVHARRAAPSRARRRRQSPDVTPSRLVRRQMPAQVCGAPVLGVQGRAHGIAGRLGLRAQTERAALVADTGRCRTPRPNGNAERKTASGAAID